eukprot:scaffold50536_cov66-Phaeocystis_antarctica.AAC.4
MLGEAYYILRHLLLPHLPGDELFVLGSILFSVAAFISALLAECHSSPPLPPGGLSRLLTARRTRESRRAARPLRGAAARPDQSRQFCVLTPTRHAPPPRGLCGRRVAVRAGRRQLRRRMPRLCPRLHPRPNPNPHHHPNPNPNQASPRAPRVRAICTTAALRSSWGEAASTSPGACSSSATGLTPLTGAVTRAASSKKAGEGRREL